MDPRPSLRTAFDVLMGLRASTTYDGADVPRDVAYMERDAMGVLVRLKRPMKMEKVLRICEDMNYNVWFFGDDYGGDIEAVRVYRQGVNEPPETDVRYHAGKCLVEFGKDMVEYLITKGDSNVELTVINHYLEIRDRAKSVSYSKIPSRRKR